MGYGDLGCYGQPYIQTPRIDAMAAQGMRFTQAYAGSPVSAPSRGSLMTGQHCGHAHVRGNREYWSNDSVIAYGNNLDHARVGQEPYDPDHVILPEVMKRNGYTTAQFGKWAGGYEGSCSTPDKRGVDEFFGYICQFQAHLYYPNFLNRYSRKEGDREVVRVTLDENIPHPMFGKGYEQRTQYSADLIHHRAMEWLEAQDGKQPFFGLLTYTLPHAELAQPSDSILQKYERQFFTDYTWGGSRQSRYNPVAHTHAQFAAMITRLDTYVGEILDKLKEKGLEENTLVIFTSDNGPHEEGGADPAFFGRDGQLQGLKRSCYEGGIRVPFIAYWPGKVPAGVVNPHQLAFYDVLPTFCELTGDKRFPKSYINKKKAGDGFDGISFAPTLCGQDERQPRHDFLYWEFHETDQMAVRCGDWKLCVVGGVPRLFNLADDLHEDYDLAALYPERVQEMVEILYREHRDHPLFPVTLPEKEPLYLKSVTFPPEATIEQKADMAARVVPTANQLAWQQTELSAFIHFGLKTFADHPRGDGTESPSLFLPTDFDANQWVRTLMEAGFRMVILTAKHHDGFCLWQTQTTTYSVASSPWRGGKGDVVKEVSDACARYGMKFGIYLSPWDRHAPCYGDSPRYNALFLQQLTELLTRYGRVDEVWLDGFSKEGPNGKKQVYDWERIYDTVRTLQPHAVTAVMGEDVRWVGNERGVGRTAEWSVTPFLSGATAESMAHRKALALRSSSSDLGSRQLLEKAQSVCWYPSETDVSIRPSWFWNSSENEKVKSGEELAQIYLNSVGRNSSLLLNVPPDRRGRLHEKDVAALQQFAAWYQRTFARSLVDRAEDTRWSCVVGESREIALVPGAQVRYILLQEDIRRGQRVERMKVELLTDQGWQEVEPVTTIGYKRILAVPSLPATRLRLTLVESRRPAHLSQIALY